MSVRYIFNTSGNYVAFISGDNLFNPDCDWIGFIKNGNEVYSSETLDFTFTTLCCLEIWYIVSALHSWLTDYAL